jgi:uncharacterized protein YndB with AHSA1/START domain
MTDARLLTDGARPAVRLERVLADPPHVVWRALTERDQLRAWFPCDVIVSGGRFTAGAAITFLFQGVDWTLAGQVLEIDEPRTLAFTWGEDTLRFELSPEGNGTRLVLIDELPPDSAARNAAGWEQCLDRLAGIEPAPDSWTPRFEHYSAAFAPEIGPQAHRPIRPTGGSGDDEPRDRDA